MEATSGTTRVMARDALAREYRASASAGAKAAAKAKGGKGKGAVEMTRARRWSEAVARSDARARWWCD